MAKKIILLTLALALSFISLLPRPVEGVTAADWKAGRIIDDGVFIDKDSMSVAQIQAFLNSKVGTGAFGVPGQCDTFGTRTSELGGGTRAQYGAAHGNPAPFTCLKDYYEVPKLQPGPGIPASNYGGVPIPAGAKSAAQLIWDAAQRYYISPKVLLVTIQKESVGPLITDDWPFKSQYTYAMGAHCPDSGPGGTANCDSNYAGFSIQISESAALFRSYLDNMTQPWWTYKKPGVNFILWNVQESGCGGSNVNIETSATAALYTYTPYQPNQAALNNMYGTGDGCSAYGNRNFWRMFNDWFGSTQFAQPIGAALYSQGSTGKVFLVTTDDNVRHYIPSWSLLQNYRLDRYRIVSIPDTTLQQYTDGGNLTNLVWDGGGVYLVDNGIKYHFPGPGTCAAWGYDCSDNTIVKQLGSNFQNNYLTTGSNLGDLAQFGSTFYKMEAGERRTIANSQTLSALGYTPKAALFLSAYNNSKPLGDLLISTPTMIKFKSKTTVYYFEGGLATPRYHSLSSSALLRDWGNPSVFIPPLSSYDSSPPSADPIGLNQWYSDGTTKYLIDQGRKIPLNTVQQQYWPAASFKTEWSQLAAGLPTVSLRQFASDGRAIYALGDDAKKHHVPTYDDYLALGVNGNSTALNATNLSVIPSGNDALGSGKIVGIIGQPGLYVINGQTALHIPNPDTFNLFGFDWGKIYTYDSSIFSDYPQSGQLDKIRSSDGSYSVMFSKWRLSLSSRMAVDFGLKTNSFISISSQVTKHLEAGVIVSKFLYNQGNGRIYYASGGALHYIQNYSSFVAYGGLSTPATTVNSDFISNFFIGQNI